MTTIRPSRGRRVPPPAPPRPAEWGPWVRRDHLADPRAREYAGANPAHAAYAARNGLRGAALNEVYAVQFFTQETPWGTVDHLVINRHDGAAGIPWADMQRIKDDLMGPERVAVEVYPPRSQLIDDANMYHLWVLPAGRALPFGLHLKGW